jgi:hypothetical protein
MLDHGGYDFSWEMVHVEREVGFVYKIERRKGLGSLFLCVKKKEINVKKTATRIEKRKGIKIK